MLIGKRINNTLVRKDSNAEEIWTEAEKKKEAGSGSEDILRRTRYVKSELGPSRKS